MNKLSGLCFVVVVALGIGTLGFADSIKLNSGEIIYGEIISDSGPAVQMRVPNESGTIFSTRDFLRTDIKEIRRSTDPETAMQEAFLNTRRFQLATYSYPLAHYNNVISNVFVKFLNTYPESPYRPDIENTLKAWTSERDEVAKGSIKYDNQWSQGDAAKTMVAAIQTTQLIAEGDRQLQSEKYELAIGQFQKALQQRPLTQQTLSLIETKCEYAFTKWTTSIPSAPSNPEVAIQSQREGIQQLQQQIQQCNQQIADIQNEVNTIASAVWIPFCRLHHRHSSSCPYYHRCPRCGCIQGHWISGERDYGSTVPDANSLTAKQNLLRLQNSVSKAQSEIARREAAITALQSGGNTGASILENIQKMRSQLATEIANAKASLSDQPAKVEVASAAANTEMGQQKPTPPPESMQPTESQSATAPVREPAQETAPPPKQPWWKEYWYLILIGIIGAFFILRR